MAQYAGRHLHTILAQEAEYKNGDYVNALRKAYLDIDNQMRSAPELTGDPSGATAVSCLITKDRIYCV